MTVVMITTAQQLLSNAEAKATNVVEINSRVWFTDHDGFRVVYQGLDTPLYYVSLDDEVQLRYVAVCLHLGGLARQHEIAEAFGHSVESQRRWERRYEAEGLGGLRRKKAPGAAFKVTATAEMCIRKWFKSGKSNREIARRLGVSEGTVRNAVRRLGLRRPEEITDPRSLPFAECEVDEESTDCAGMSAIDNGGADEASEVEAETVLAVTEPNPGASFATSIDPLDRTLDRVLARLGFLDDAEPIFADVERLPGAGTFLMIPLLVESGVLEIFARLYRSIGPAFYGLRSTVVCLVMLALLRIKRPENLKEHDPQALGRLLGLDRAPEVKTLRRKLDALAGRGKGLELMRALAERRVEDREGTIGVLYVDGHVKEYHGQAKLGEAFITRRRLSAPAATDTWVNDINGDPLFMVSSEFNAGLTKTLEPVLAEVREIVGDDRRITVAFDRGGWSTKLFHRLNESGFDVITYRKNHDPRIPVHQFEDRVHVEGGIEHSYKLHDQPRVRVGRTGVKKGKGPQYMWMRQVTLLCEDGHQVPVITTRDDLPAESVLFYMFHRWRQENFFKYMREEFALDGLVEYGTEPVTEQVDHPNPEVRKINKELRSAQAELAEIEQAIGQELQANEESRRRSVRGFKIAQAPLLRQAEQVRQRIARLRSRKQKLPKRVPTSDLQSLKKDRKVVSDAIKMVAYQIESDLVNMVADDYARCADEGRTLLHAAFRSAGDLEIRDGELHVTLVPQSSPHRTRAIAKLCQKLTEMHVTVPGSQLRLSLAVAEPVNIG